MKNIKSLVLVLSLFSFVLSSCSEDVMDGINKNPNYPLDVEAKFMIAELETSTAFSVVGGDFSFYLASYIEHEVGVFNQLYNAETRSGEPILGSTFNNVWQSAIYTNIKTAKIIIAKCSEGGYEEGNDVTLGVAKVLLAYNAAVLTDLFGDVPYSEAAEMNLDGTPKYMQPKVDSQKDIYKSIFTHLDEAISLFDNKDTGVTGAMGGKDFIYSGNAAKWKKAAYGLKARYAMRLLNRSETKTKDLEDILDNISKSFSGVNEEFKYAKYDGASQYNPLFSFTYSRLYFGASESLVEKLKERNDPRLNNTFCKYVRSTQYDQIKDVGKLMLAPNGKPFQVQAYYSIPLFDLAIDAPTMLLSYHEMLFLKAEALARLSKPVAEIEVALKSAITVGLANMENSSNSAVSSGFIVGDAITLDREVSEKYFDESVKTRFDAHPLKEIMLQKYLAFWGASGEAVEAYNDYRRLKAADEDFISLSNPKNATQFPLRLPYGSDEMTANENVKKLYTDQGNYVYTERVWWAGGTR